MTLLYFILGLILLIAGAEALVRGASRIAERMGISPLIIGLTIVAFGTSSPELAVSVKSALSGQSAVALGNVLGSNIFNVLFILGLSALITPLVVARQLIRLDVPLMIGISAGVFLMALDRSIGWIDGGLLILGLLGYVYFLFTHTVKGETVEDQSDAGGNSRQEPNPGGSSGLLLNLGLALGGLALLVLGARWLVDSAVSFATAMGVSEMIVGLTIVAAGTSLPEVVTSLLAALRGERDIAIGNVVGSNIFNLLGVLGLAGLVAPDGIEVAESVLRFDLPVMTVVALTCLPLFFTGSGISRWEGGLLLGYYAAYTIYLVLAASHHDALEGYGIAMMYVVIPLTVLTVVVIALREWRSKHGGEQQDA